MSSYIYIYRKVGDETFVPLLERSSYSTFYQIFSGYAEFECVFSISSDDLIEGRNKAKTKYKEIIEDIQKLKAREKEIGTWNNSIEEKMEILHDLDSLIEEKRIEAEENKDTICAINLLLDIIKLASYTDEELNEDEVLYIGIETGVRITTDDIVGKE